MNNQPLSASQLQQLALQIKTWGQEAGFQQVGITDTDLQQHPQHLQQWLNNGYQGDMQWMADHDNKRYTPDALVEQTQRVISFRMDYLAPDVEVLPVLERPEDAYVSRYALGRDYHKLMRKRLSHIAKQIEAFAGGAHRAFVDSAPVLEKALAEKAGLGWIGKNTLLVNNKAGSWFFLGEIYTSVPLPIDQQATEHCGTCSACLDICPTNAFVGPWQLDARRCISYLTIEHKGAIAEELRPLMGNRIYGCDDCLAICPWNKFAQPTPEADFLPRNGLDTATLLTLFLWDEAQFLQNTEGSAIRRIGYERWQRNLSIALGNSTGGAAIIDALEKKPAASPMVKQHIDWALANLKQPLSIC